MKSSAETIQKLDSFKSMVAELQEYKIPSGSTENHDDLTSKINVDFETNMNNDLDVKSAFDGLTKTTSELHEMREAVKLERCKKCVE